MKKLLVKKRQFITEDQEPFFFTACTAWELFHKLTFAEAKRYLDNRAAKGFNVIQAVAVAELDGLNTPSYEGQHVPFHCIETLSVNEAYFDHVVNVVNYANSKGLYVALVPMWGSYIVPTAQWGNDVQPIFHQDNVVPFISYLADKMQNCDVIWMIGGDRSYLKAEHRKVMRLMADSIRAVCGTSQLITAHTQGGRSLYDMLEQPDWLDFLTWQTGHMGAAYPSWYPVEHDYNRHDMPIINAEPCYEAHPIMNEYTFTRSDGASRHTDAQIRRASYWSVFAGSAGITYGCYSLWQMRREEDDAIEVPESAAVAYRGDTIPYWHQVLDYPGAFQIGILRRFIDGLYQPEKRVPANELLLSDNPAGESHVRVMKHEAGEWVAAYIPENQKIILDVSEFGVNGFEIYWFNPIYGITNKMSDDITESLILNITTPLNQHDWVLLLQAKP
ncbi:Putative endoglucanase [Vibrio aerogenes CECT 7868]|uniref:Putative endoglucanase n=1 Tax=Vibrio aerogenes CECT 7868 TaxID=1216006 RepID=A0A1M5ZNY3_9VIBR|nr:DUF4038 domain-containing protein [Vibrio aerogenes]SHI25613.1 Putative endoglucanase [Vibrio aerogenes CECT 7868]